MFQHRFSLLLVCLVSFLLISSGTCAFLEDQNTPATASANIVNVIDRAESALLWGWKPCDSASPSDAIMNVTSVTLSPTLPQPGKTLTVTVDATAVNRVEDGAYATMSIQLGDMKIYEQQYDLCEEARKASTTIQCPVEAGESHTVSHDVKLPPVLPPGPIAVHIEGNTVAGEPLLCFELSNSFPQ